MIRKLFIITMSSMLVIAPVSAFGIGVPIDDADVVDVDGVLCGLIGESRLPGKINKKQTKFIDYLSLKKKFAKIAKTASGATAAKAKTKKKKFKKAHNDGLASCESIGGGGNEQGSVFNGMQIYQTSCALSGCHGAGGNPVAPGTTAQDINNSYENTIQMSALTPPNASDLADLVAYFASLL
ncbi:MAG: hypothetical protein KDD55_03765 [Bdellovibrionales bacterium]|nr:hypothetical protein [Bdellovibrionales bacterium]